VCHGNAWCSGNLIRHTLEAYHTYEEAVTCLSHHRLAVPSYFTLVGSNQNATEAAVIACDLDPRDSKVVPWTAHSKGLVQTNMDEPLFSNFDNTLPPLDMYSTDRYEVAQSFLEQQTIPYVATASDVAKVLCTSLKSLHGVRMKMTLYFSIMKPYDVSHSIVSARPTRFIGPG